jgi:hypothetical protein
MFDDSRQLSICIYLRLPVLVPDIKDSNHKFVTEFQEMKLAYDGEVEDYMWGNSCINFLIFE